MLRCRALRDLCAVHAGDMLRVHEIRRQTRRELAAVNGATQSRRRVALMRHSSFLEHAQANVCHS